MEGTPSEEQLSFETQLSMDKRMEEVFIGFCNMCGLNLQLQSEAWLYWISLLQKFPHKMEGDLLHWMCCAVYKFLEGRPGFVDSNDGTLQRNVPAYKLCQHAFISFSTFLMTLRNLEKNCLVNCDPSSLELSKKYCATVAMSAYHKQICQFIFQEGDSYEEAIKLPWLVFIVAKSLQVGSSEHLSDLLNLFVCCISFAITLTKKQCLKPPFTVMSLAATDSVACVFEYLCLKLSLPIQKFYALYKESWIPFQMFLQQICHYLRNDMVEYLESKYLDVFNRVNDFNEILFLKYDPVLAMNAEKNVMPRIFFYPDMITIAEISKCPSYHISKDLQKFFASSKYTEKKFNNRLSSFTSWFVEMIGPKVDLVTNNSTRLCTVSIKLYLMKLENILKSEEVKVPQTDFSVLFGTTGFHKALFAVCVAAVLEDPSESHIKHDLTLSWIASSMNIPAFHMHIILETFILHEPFLPDHLTKYLKRYEVTLLLETIWKETHAAEFLDFTSTSKTYDLTGDLLKNTFMDKDLSPNIKYIISRIRSLMQSRLLLFCEALDMDDDQFINAWPCLEHAIFFRNRLPKERHLDQLMLCSVYAIAKVIGKELQFRQLVSCYKRLKLGPQAIWKYVYISDNNYDSIIQFYNSIFMPSLKDFVLRLGLHIESDFNSSTLHTSFLQLRSSYLKEICWF